MILAFVGVRRAIVGGDGQSAAYFVHDSPSHTRPFLRKQESPCRDSGNNRRPKPKSAHNIPYTSRPFLRRQESILSFAANGGVS